MTAPDRRRLTQLNNGTCKPSLSGDCERGEDLDLRDETEHLLSALLELLPVEGSWTGGYKVGRIDPTVTAMCDEWATAAHHFCEVHRLLTQQSSTTGNSLEDLKFGPRSYTPEQAAVITEVVADRRPLASVTGNSSSEGQQARPGIETLPDGRPSGKTWPERLYVVWDCGPDRFNASEEDTWLPEFPRATYVLEPQQSSTTGNSRGDRYCTHCGRLDGRPHNTDCPFAKEEAQPKDTHLSGQEVASKHGAEQAATGGCDQAVEEHLSQRPGQPGTEDRPGAGADPARAGSPACSSEVAPHLSGDGERLEEAAVDVERRWPGFQPGSKVDQRVKLLRDLATRLSPENSSGVEEALKRLWARAEEEKQKTAAAFDERDKMAGDREAADEAGLLDDFHRLLEELFPSCDGEGFLGEEEVCPGCPECWFNEDGGRA